MLVFIALLATDTQAQDNSNAKVYGMHMMMLKPGVTDAQFEKFVVDRLYPSWDVPGWKMSVLKGDRGDREGRYMLLVEIKSVAYRDELAPADGPPSEKLMTIINELRPEWEQLSSVPGIDTFYTDYYVVGDK